MSTIELIKQDYCNGNINLTEYHELLNGLNKTIFEMDRYKLLGEINPGEIQEIIHQEQERFYKDLRESMKEPGVNVIFNGYIHHFDDPAWFDTLLGRMADSVHETDKNNSVLYNDELN